MRINLEKLKWMVDFFKANPERLDMYYFSRYPHGCGSLAGYAAFGNDLGKAKFEELCRKHEIDPHNHDQRESIMNCFEMDSTYYAGVMARLRNWPDVARSKYMQADEAGSASGRVDALEMLYDYVASRADGQS